MEASACFCCSLRLWVLLCSSQPAAGGAPQSSMCFHPFLQPPCMAERC